MSCRVAPAVRLTVAGLTVIEATGIRVTVSEALPLFPSLVAVTCAVPTEGAVTGPETSTVANASLLEDQGMSRPERALPAASNVVAIASDDSAVVIEGGVSATATDATGIVSTATIAL